MGSRTATRLEAVSDYGEALTVSKGWEAYVEDTGVDVALVREDCTPARVALTSIG